jgi:alanyl-tRNA synthetase
MRTAADIRESFLRFFESKGHKRVHSSSLVPHNDPTLLFTNAGMNQFKDTFLGIEKRGYDRATTSQKCVRAGGKHNDLENVGFTNRHHTFFEMLGNFSFGDYFKRDAIAYAWELITSKEWYGVPKEKLYATIFKGEDGVPRDDEAEKFWIEAGVPKERVFAMGMKDNFWQMGDTGPCGPCSEIHFDMGVESSDKRHPECAAGKCQFPCPHDCGRYVEIWNLVFMQFDRDSAGKLTPLPKPSIDTGMGLERIAAVLQGVVSNYNTDLFTPLTQRAAELTGVSAKKELEKEAHAKSAASLRVIADHARAATFLISDGVTPGNEGRGYVLRKIMRRAIRHGRLLGKEEPFLSQMVFAVRDGMKGGYPELVETAERVAKVVEAEELQFGRTLELGLQRLDDLIASAKPGEGYGIELGDGSGTGVGLYGKTSVSGSGSGVGNYGAGQRDGSGGVAVLLGADAFKLYDTFGLPLDFMVDAARDAGIAFDQTGFDKAMEEQRATARASWRGGSKQSANPYFRELPQTLFKGYSPPLQADGRVLAIFKGGANVPELNREDEGEIVLDQTPFYAESGGQVGDVGVLKSQFGDQVLAEVIGCYQPVQGVRSHRVRVKERITHDSPIRTVVDTGVRTATMRNHTATHLLHAALREVLGKHVKQAGSLVDPGHLRFDFSHFTGVADEELQDIEDIVNKEVLRNTKVETIADVPIDVAINEYKAMALFGEKYGDKVRVIRIGDFSVELCGGTHTAATGEIGLVKLLGESSVSSGVRRVEAISGEGSLRHFRKDHQLEHAARSLGIISASEDSAAEALRRGVAEKDDEIKRLRRELEQMRMKSAAASVSSAGEQVKEVNGIKVLAQRVPDNIDRGQMRTLVDNLRNKLGSGVVLLGSVQETPASDGKPAEKKVALICGVTKDLTAKVQAGKIVGEVAKKVGGSGGGRPDMAEAGGKDVAALDAALASVSETVLMLTK